MLGKISAPPAGGPVFMVNWNPQVGLHSTLQASETPSAVAALPASRLESSNQIIITNPVPAPASTFVAALPAPPALRALEYQGSAQPLEVNVNVTTTPFADVGGPGASGASTAIPRARKGSKKEQKMDPAMLTIKRAPSEDIAAVDVPPEGPSVEVYEVFETRKRLRFCPWISWRVNPNKKKKKRKCCLGCCTCANLGKGICGTACLVFFILLFLTNLLVLNVAVVKDTITARAAIAALQHDTLVDSECGGRDWHDYFSSWRSWSWVHNNHYYKLGNHNLFRHCCGNYKSSDAHNISFWESGRSDELYNLVCSFDIKHSIRTALQYFDLDTVVKQLNPAFSHLHCDFQCDNPSDQLFNRPNLLSIFHHQHNTRYSCSYNIFDQ
ncbi:hypothetical protein HKX48_007638 [Thoreauomyces humboldtii]|nr:hypothetical protein HKX48_007638 [Thoreauomyces humboldtii]